MRRWTVNPKYMEKLTDKNIVIFDLDGTLANIEHRLHFIKQSPPDWEAFFQECDKDSVFDPVYFILTAISGYEPLDLEPMILSARSRLVLHKTRDWLDSEYMKEIPLVMLREEGDYTRDEELKRQWLYESGLKNRILCVFDDRKKVVDMWRHEGIICFQVAEGNY